MSCDTLLENTVHQHTKAQHPFWLDGGYDRGAVEACPYHPEHRWWEFSLGDVLEDPTHPEERMVICKGCYVPRCSPTADPDPCMRPRHHREMHKTRSGKLSKVGA